MSDDTTPYDKPRTIIERLLFPSLRDAYRSGYSDGRWMGVLNTNRYWSDALRDPNYVRSLIEDFEATDD
jgi:hypothetical protein